MERIFGFLSIFHKYNMATIDDYFIRTTSSKLEGVKTDYPDAVLIHVHDENGNRDELYAGGELVTDKFNIGDMDESIQTEKLGGLESSTLGELKNKGISQIIMDMVCPLVLPTPQVPTVQISCSNLLMKVGDNLPGRDDIRVTPNGGNMTESALSISSGSFGGVAEEGVYSISCIGTFDAGEIPVDSHRNPHPEIRYPGGNVSSNTLKITAVYPIKVNTESISDMTEQHLVNYNSEQSLTVSIPAEVDGTMNKFMVELPYAFSKFVVKQYNPVSGEYDIPVNMERLEGGDGVLYVRTTDLFNTHMTVTKYKITIKK